MQKLLYVGIGGFIGASLRYLISLAAPKIFGNNLPYGTLIVNILGGILIGLIMEISLTTNLISPNLKLFLTTGIMGGLTTFSTFSYETISLLCSGSYILGFLNICLNLFLSLGGVVLGKFLAHLN
ncbi:CrcB protein [Clostridium cavendishii DSM 21758]|uniref:Fluoride-specific ion channel FluC n=1 Tax=Clostridium cavendishii DSM 21758 TaxID=1121302 RepID=A0A1M6D1G6_9CLOT|nr:fluoride efflux transporter CrcB [Clostridium cavendishii]SHI66818.1 CrcB protein [Clostridium cavendishii DSM 21758]